MKRLLIANRGEIAVRIIRAARELNIETVAVYSDRDAGAAHVRMADKRICLGGANARDNYLNQEKTLLAAKQSGADALHPGYGFFAENAEFAQAVVDSGLIFVGPKPETVALMGDKERARAVAAKAGVPIVPGTAAGASKQVIEKFALETGYPLMVKAVAGGSGRGMRVVQREDELFQKINEAEREAEAAFGKKEVLIEKYLDRPRHIEVQLFGDGAGKVLHFGERECSVQRRQQKLIEECPAPRLSAKLREKIIAAAVSIGKAVSYESAGTIEFLVLGGESATDAFYFLEMNTRIQVEHPVTEAATGLDLVKLQLELAKTKKLDLEQKNISWTGHAIEFRIYAEDPTADFKPTSGLVSYVARAGGPGVREDGWVESGVSVSPLYDSLLAKLTVWGRDRAEAIERARRALDDYVVDGLPTTLEFHRWLVREQVFQRAELDVFWISRNYHGEVRSPVSVGPLVAPQLKS